MHIYKITNKITGQFYIGKAVDYLSRFENHKRSASLDGKNNRSISKNMRAYGVENFEVELLVICPDEDWRHFEMECIKEHRTKSPEKCLNILVGSGAQVRPVLEITTRTTFDSTQHAADFLMLFKNDIRYACRCKLGLANMNPRLKERLRGYDFQYTYMTKKELEQQKKKRNKK